MFSALDLLNTALALFGPTFLPVYFSRLKSTDSLRTKPGSLDLDDDVR